MRKDPRDETWLLDADDDLELAAAACAALDLDAELALQAARPVHLTSTSRPRSRGGTVCNVNSFCPALGPTAVR